MCSQPYLPGEECIIEFHLRPFLNTAYVLFECYAFVAETLRDSELGNEMFRSLLNLRLSFIDPQNHDGIPLSTSYRIRLPEVLPSHWHMLEYRRLAVLKRFLTESSLSPLNLREEDVNTAYLFFSKRAWVYPDESVSKYSCRCLWGMVDPKEDPFSIIRKRSAGCLVQLLKHSLLNQVGSTNLSVEVPHIRLCLTEIIHRVKDDSVSMLEQLEIRESLYDLACAIFLEKQETLLIADLISMTLRSIESLESHVRCMTEQMSIHDGMLNIVEDMSRLLNHFDIILRNTEQYDSVKICSELSNMTTMLVKLMAVDLQALEMVASTTAFFDLGMNDVDPNVDHSTEQNDLIEAGETLPTQGHPLVQMCITLIPR